MKRYWYKMYVEDVFSKKRMQLPDWLFRRLVEFEAFAADFGEDGLLPPVADMAWILRPVDETKLSEALQGLSQVGEVEQTSDGGWRLTSFSRRHQESKMPADWPIQGPNKNTAGVYGIHCLGTGKWYVGASANVFRRLKQHFYEMHYFGALFEDAQRFGVQSMKAGVLEYVDDLPRLPEAEAYWIKKLDSLVNGYNHQDSGNNRHWK